MKTDKTSFIDSSVLALLSFGATPKQIMDVFKLDFREAMKLISRIEKSNNIIVKEDPEALNAALNKAINGPIEKEIMVVDERQRFQRYSEIENSCLNIMSELLLIYSNKLGEDLKTDKFISSLANSFIKNTQSARQELLKKYAIDKFDERDVVQLEFFNPREETK